MADEMDERYARASALAELDKRHSVLDATVTHQLTRISSDLSEIKMLSMQRSTVQPPADHVNWQATAMRAMDVLERQKGAGGNNSALTALAIIGACALTAAGMWLVLGHH